MAGTRRWWKRDNKAAKAKDEGVKPKRSRIRSCLKWTVWLAWNGLALVAAIAGIYTVIWPHVYVSPSVRLDPNNPTFTCFTVHRQGYLPIRNVKLSGAMNRLQRPDGTLILAQVPFENDFAIPTQVSYEIASGEEASELLPFSQMGHNRFVRADIAVRLEYKLVWRPFHERKELHRFVLVRGKDGQWHWLPQPIKKFK